MTIRRPGWQKILWRWHKSETEVPTRKRAVYRKRFAFLDDIDVQIANAL